MDPLEPAALVDRVFGDRYRTVAPLGAGSIADVFAAEDLVDGGLVALKVFSQAIGEDPDIADRVVEAVDRTLGLDHPNIVRILDQGIDGVRIWVASELCRGGSLRSVLDRGDRLTPSQALIVALECTRALEHGHERGIVHGNLRPENIVFGDDQRVRLADYGLNAIDGDLPFSRSGLVLESLRYAAPEQAVGAGAHPAGDLYSLALVINEAVAGEVPEVRDTALATRELRSAATADLSSALGDLRPPLDRCGAVDPLHRPEAGELTIALLAAAETMPRPRPIELAGLGVHAALLDELDDPGDIDDLASLAELDAGPEQASGVAASVDLDDERSEGDEGGGLTDNDPRDPGLAEGMLDDPAPADGPIGTDVFPAVGATGGDDGADADRDGDGRGKVDDAGETEDPAEASAGDHGDREFDDPGDAGDFVDDDAVAAARLGAGDLGGADAVHGVGDSEGGLDDGDLDGGVDRGEPETEGAADGPALVVVPDLPDVPEPPTGQAVSERVGIEDLSTAEPVFAAEDETVEPALDVPSATSPAADTWQPDEEDLDNDLPRWPLALLAALLAVAIAAWLGMGLGGTETAVVPDVVGVAFDDLDGALADHEWQIERREARRNGTAAGVVIDQAPAADTELAAGGLFVVTVSLGNEMVEIPSDVAGLTIEKAQLHLAGVGLVVGAVTEEQSETVDAGLVIGIDEPIRQKPQGEAVSLRLSSGPADRVVPDEIIGGSIGDATALLAGLRLQAIEEQVYDPDAEPGTVLGAVPAPGQVVPADSQVTLLVSAGPEPVVMPDLAELSLAEAIDAIEALGLVFLDTEGTPGEPVLSTIPEAGEVVDVGTEVVIVLAEADEEDDPEADDNG